MSRVRQLVVLVVQQGLLISLIDNSGSHAATSLGMLDCQNPSPSQRVLSALTFSIQATILGSTTCSSHVPSAAARQFHA